ncbi:hypothetical protein TSUD_357940 [Trifolium subterraneum]|uniref:Uncharacterized protein n=1 Tax=Trifolium subterraneum TaxID=3900 RepID=A0A2Z6MAW3_TRISU|nr:hypothetical protein TSUD_357940 [Trifolium subterraneum]
MFRSDFTPFSVTSWLFSCKTTDMGFKVGTHVGTALGAHLYEYPEKAMLTSEVQAAQHFHKCRALRTRLAGARGLFHGTVLA